MKKKVLLILSSFVLIFVLLISNLGITYAKDTNIDDVLKSKEYSSLSNKVKDFIKEYYEEKGVILLTKELAKDGQAYLNPSYIKYLDSEDKSGYYVIPSITAYKPVLKTTNTKSRGGAKSPQTLPSSFDLRNVNDKNFVTPNKDQGNEGLCWAYATASLLETHDLIVKNKSYDSTATLFSEKQMDYALSSDGIIGGNKVVPNTSRKLTDGGDFGSIEKYLSLHLLGVNDSWTIDNNTIVSQNKPLEPSIVFNRDNVIYEAGETTRFLNVNSDLSNTEYNEAMKNIIKDIVYNYGGAIVNIKVGNNNTINNNLNLSEFINVVKEEYASSLSGEQHALHIIGWDDDYEYGYCTSEYQGRKNIYSHNPVINGEIVCLEGGPDTTVQAVTGKGAWILKNSWGDQYSYLYLTYDSIIDGLTYINSYSEKNWDNNYDLTDRKIGVSNNEISFTYSFTKYGNVNNERVKKLKVDVQGTEPFSIYFSVDGNENNYTLVGSYNYDYAGYKEIDVEDKNIILNTNSKFRLIGSNTFDLEVFSTNSNSDPTIYTSDYTYSLENEKPSSANYLNIETSSYLRNISDNTQITYKIKDSQGDYLPNAAYEVMYNRSYDGMVTPLIKLYSDYIETGTLYLDALKNNILLYTSQLVFEVGFMPISGSGTSDDPWQVENVRHFNMIRNANRDYYILKNDIDFEYDTRDPNGLFYNSASGWKAIYFSGNLDGNGKTLKNIKTSSGLFGTVSINSNCKFDTCGVHDLNVDNIEHSYASSSKGGVINDLSITTAYNADVSNISATNVVFNSNLSNNSGGIAGTVSVNDNPNDWIYTFLKIDNWYADVNFKGTQYPQGFNAFYLGGLIGKVYMITDSATAYFSLNNAKANVHFNLNTHYNKEYHLSDIIGVIDNAGGKIRLDNSIGIVSYENENNANASFNAFIGYVNHGSGSNVIYGSKSTLNYTPTLLINSTNYEAGLKPYELARANYNNITYYEDPYFTFDENSDGRSKVEFSDKFNVYGDKIPTLKSHPEDYSTYYKTYSMRVGQTKSIDDLISNDTDYRKLKVYSSFNCNLDVCNNTTDQTVISVPTELNGYTFEGLKSGSTTLILYDELSGYLDTVEINVLGNNQHLVTFDSNGGSSVASQVVNNNGKATQPENPTKENKVFVEWQLNGQAFDFNTAITSDITLTAVWRDNNYTVTFDSNGGSNVASQTVNYNSPATRPTNPTKRGYNFVEWQLNGQTYDFSSPVTSNITLVAVWSIKQYTVTFNSEGGTSVPSQTVDYNTPATRPENPTQTGYNFREWQLNGTTYSFSDPVTSNITLVAVWDIKRFPVIFNSNGGTDVDSQTVKYNKKAQRPADPTREGYVFVEWQLNGQTFDFDTPITDTITLTAVWSETMYTVTFNSNGGSSVNSQSISYNGKATKPANPTKTGYTFVEWQLNGQAYDFNTIVTENITLVATWTINKYTVTFNSNGGSNVTNQTIDYNNKATKPSNPTREGYTFKEWQLNNSLYDFNTPVTGNITLVAIWTINKFTVTFDSSGGSSVASQTINYLGTVTKPSNPTRNGYTFKEWQLNGAAYNFNTPITSNITLTATWTKNEVIDDDTLKDILEDNGYNVTSSYVSKFKIGDTIAAIKSKLGSDVTVETSQTIISTGAVIKKGNESYIVVIKGDLTGEGKVNSGDLLQMRKYLLEEINLTGAYKEAGIIESVGNIKSLDLLRLRQYLLGEYEFK